MTKTLRKDAFILGGHGRGMQNKISKTTKRNLDRKVDKRRRQKWLEELRQDFL